MPSTGRIACRNESDLGPGAVLAFAVAAGRPALVALGAWRPPTASLVIIAMNGYLLWIAPAA